MKRRFGTLLCAAALLLALAIPANSVSSEPVYLLAVNDRMCDLPNGTLPISNGGVIYVPYTVFDKDSSGVDLGVYYGISQDRGAVLTLYALSGRLTFTINNNTCVDGQGNSLNWPAILRNGIPYVPAAAVCGFFGLNYSFLPTADRGTLIRITNSAATASDSSFLSSVTLHMTTRYNNIIQSRESLPVPASSVSPTPTTAPTTAPGGQDSKEDVRVYLAINASDADSDLTALFPSGVHALFLFTPDSLSAQSAQVRRALALGHSVGLIVDGDLDAALAQLERGNELLTHIARVRTRIVSAPAALTDSLTASGWACWQSNVTGQNAYALLANLELRQVVGRVDLIPNATAVNRIMTRLREDRYTIRQPLETEL
ncbi:hypothetical protein [Vermiculatibacterium agrestimuris]|uniref:hypothetical protein n=1 Tax=Vermiculatibacterium agrestimuris TaxID=2941519 RepID=UPI002040C51C|nr:hypothetical protein [Vermiculatibacterium agrestimuris]